MDLTKIPVTFKRQNSTSLIKAFFDLPKFMANTRSVLRLMDAVDLSSRYRYFDITSITEIDSTSFLLKSSRIDPYVLKFNEESEACRIFKEYILDQVWLNKY